MKSLTVISLIASGLSCFSQTSFVLSDPRLEVQGNTLHISYDILDGDPDAEYDVSINIRDDDGIPITAKAFDGDVGEKVSGGSNKHVTWNLEADNIFINAYLNVSVKAKVIHPQAPVNLLLTEGPDQGVSTEEQDVRRNPPADEPTEGGMDREDKARETEPVGTGSGTERVSESGSSGFSRAGIMLQSLAVPGLGLSRVTGKPHWLRAVAGYGSIIGSVVLNRQSVSTFNTIEDLDNIDDVNSAFDKSVKQDNASEILAYTAIGVWVTDILWTFLGTTESRSPALYTRTKGFTLKSEMDPISRAPLMGFVYRF